MLVLATPLSAQTVTSAEPDSIAVTLYRDPNRGAGPIERDWPRGYALITEQRRITIPAGRSTIRFEGVSEGMLPESALVAGLPAGVVEKNRDALLLSPAGLVDAYLTRRVHLQRTNLKTGRVREQEAVIRAGPGGGVVLQTAEGVEALACSGLPESLSYDGVPDGLFARQTLSVVADSPQPVTATVALSYLAQGFDWAANYVAQVAPDGRTLDLFAWMTMANGGAQSFPDAETQAVAGQPNRQSHDRPPEGPSPQLVLQCWPMDITSTHPVKGLPPPPPPPPPPPSAPAYADGESIVVTGSRIANLASAVAIEAVQEELGDLKLYRIPERVTVAANGQKQVAMLQRARVPFERIHGASVDSLGEESAPMRLLLRTRNDEANNLGLPLPAGGVAIFELAGDRPLLVGEDDLRDHAIGEEVEIEAGASSDVRASIRALKRDRRSHAHVATITNARDTAVEVELLIPYELSGTPRGLTRKNGGWAWRTRVPANGAATLRYALRLDRN